MAKPSKPVSEPEVTPAPVNVDILAGHYQKTFEVTNENLKERNKIFVLLVLTAGIGLMLLLRVPTADALIVAAIAKFLGITDETAKATLQTSFPFHILLSGFLVVMFYFIQRLYSTNLSVMRNFMYLGALEKEIRGHMHLPTDSIAFTREGGFYWGKRRMMQKASKWLYIIVLFIILIPFIAFKIQADFNPENLAWPTWIILTVDVIVSLMTISYWWEYSYSSINLDKPKMSAEKTG
ncbi:MAG: hypothetical protein C4583_06500 [Anaerolineaceae bacterium]|nr:MAG: hypothetical protein C4583_06500 [Anaerolineaceae bacterium]